MNRFIRCTIACALGSAMLAGCSVPGFGDSSTDAGDKSAYYDNDSSNSSVQNYSWILEPAVSADNIITFDGSQVNSDNELNKAYANYSVIRTNSKYGLVDYGGNIVVEPAYDYFYTCTCGEVVLYNIADAENDIYEYCSIDSSHQVVNFVYNHSDTTPRYYWADDKIYVINNGDETGKEYTGKKAVVVGKATVSEAGGDAYNIEPQEDTLYGLAKQNKLVTELKYTDFYAPAYKGAGLTAIAFKDENGKWGYVGSDGKSIIEFKCGDDPVTYNGTMLDDLDKSHPYLFSDDFVPVTIDGLWGYYNLDGDCVVRVGEFEQARPVHNGRAWVRKNGLWGVIQLGEVIEEETIQTTTTTTTATSMATYSTRPTSTTQQTSSAVTTSETGEATGTTQMSEVTTLPTETTTQETLPPETQATTTQAPETQPPVDPEPAE